MDRAEIALYPHASEDEAESLCRHRADLDAWLTSPTGRAAEGERALLRALGG